jgi:hypothetical protein
VNAVRAVLAASLALAGWPLPASAAVGARLLPVRAPSPAAQVRLSLPSAPLSPSLSAPSLSPSLAPSLPSLGAAPLAPAAIAPLAAAAASPALPPLAAAPAAPAAASPVFHASHQRLVVAGEAVAAAAGAPDPSADASRGSADAQFSLLTGELAAERPDALPVPADGPSVLRSLDLLRYKPEPGQDPEVTRKVKRMMLATSVMKAGTETVTLGVPLLILTSFGGATLVAAMVVGYGLTRAAFGAGVEGLTRRWSARRVLAGAVTAQAALVTVILGLGAAGMLSVGTLFPLYLLIGGTVGVIETSRRVIPALLLGRDDTVLSKYNARLHIWYEVAGVTGALSAGALIAFAGPLWALLIQPPAYLLAAWLFFGVKHAKPEPEPGAGTGGSVLAKVKRYLADIRESGKLVLGDARLRWIALAFVFPHIVHRVFEGLLIPVFAKRVLEEPSFSAYLLTASNLGELVGAALLLKFAERVTVSKWVKWGGLGLVLAWGMVFTHSLPLLLPVILLFSMTWAASDLSLLSAIQKHVKTSDTAGAIAFLNGAYVLGGAAASLLMGYFLDAMPLSQAVMWICAAFTALGAAVWYAGKKLD